MDQLKIEGTLPVALKKLVGQTTIVSKKVIMFQITAIEYIEAQATLTEGQYISIGDLTAMTKLIDENGQEHEITYDMLGHSSRSNLDYLRGLKEKLEAKEQAES